MLYDISHYFGWIAAAFLLGAIVGWLTYQGPHGKWLAGWFKWGAAAFVVGLIVALFNLLPGRFGSWLETALLLFGGYILGGHVGAWLKSLTADKSAAPALDKTVSRPSTPATPAANGLAGKVGAAGAVATGGAALAASAAKTGATNAVSGAATGMAAKAGDAAATATSGAAGMMAGATGAVTGAASNATNTVSGAATGMAAKASDAAATATSGAAGMMAGATGAVTGAASNATNAVSGAATGMAAKASDAAATATSGAAGMMAGAAMAAKSTTSPAALPGEAPPALAAPMGGKADDLKLIKGIGPKNEAVLNGLGYHHFSQIAAWTPPQEEWIGHRMAFPGRIEREHWVPQAKSLAAGIDTDHARAVKAGLKIEDSAEDHMVAASAPATVSFLRDPPAKSTTAAMVYGPHHVLVMASDSHLPGKAPATQVHADDGRGDDLTQIKGIGAVNQSTLNALGVHHFHQIAAWTPDNATWMGHKMAFPGRIEREEWVPQAKQLALSRPAPVARAAEPAPAAALADEGAHEGQRPAGFMTPRGGKADDLKRIRGIGRQNEERLNGLGIWHFDQIAGWSHENARWVGSYLAFPGRIDREEWVSQAKVLASGQETEFSRRVEAGEVASSLPEGVHKHPH